MGHELWEREGKWSMAFVGDTPWHSLGQNIPENSPLEVWAKEAMLEWEVKRADARFRLQDFKGLLPDTKEELAKLGNEVIMPHRKILYRSDTAAPLSVVSDRYKPVQPKEILEFFRSLIEENGFKMETAGSLKGGQRIWALASTGMSGSIMGQDRIGNYLLLATSCDGSLATTAQFTTIRVVCNNTLSFAYMQMQQALKDQEDKEIKDIVKVPHNAIFNPDAVKIELGLVDDFFKQFMDDAGALAKVKVDETAAFDYFINLMAKPGEDEEPDLDTASDTNLRRLFHCYRGARGQDLASSKSTAWGLVNAVTYFTDHEKPAQSQDNRINSAWFGDGSRLKAKAMDLALETFVRKAA
jgi:phage/plasmid-like protein (TIGR03299 family)